MPYYLGCPSWSEPAWRGSLYPEGSRSADFLPLYAQVFNAVEGNTTFYAKPSVDTVARWAERHRGRPLRRGETLDVGEFRISAVEVGAETARRVRVERLPAARP